LKKGIFEKSSSFGPKRHGYKKNLTLKRHDILVLYFEKDGKQKMRKNIKKGVLTVSKKSQFICFRSVLGDEFLPPSRKRDHFLAVF